MEKTFSQRYLLPVVILSLAFGLRLYQLDFQSIWWDEGHSIFVAEHPLRQIPTLPAMDVHPPAYFAFLHLWMSAAGSSEFALRYFSAIFSLLTVALLWQFGAAVARSQRQTRWQTAALTALLAALSPLYVAYAQEVRSYAMITFLALASSFILWRLLLADRPGDTAQKRAGLLLGYVLLTAACLYTHYFTIFLLLFHNLVWAAWLLRGKLVLNYSPKTMLVHAALWAASQLGILLLFGPQLLLAIQQVTDYANPNLLSPGFSYFLSQSWQAYTVGLALDAAAARWGAMAIAVALLASWVTIAAFQRRRLSPALARNFLFLLAWLLVPLAAYFVVLQRRPSFEPRYMMLVTPALFLLLGPGLARLSTVARYVSRPSARAAIRITQISLGLLTFAGLLAGLAGYYTDARFFKDDSAGVAAWLATETTPNDVVYVDVPHPFHYYAKRQNIPAPVRYLFVDIHTAADTLQNEASGRDRLFWITWRGSDTDPRGVVPFLAEKAGRFGGQRDFRGYRVAWYDLRPEAPFSLPQKLNPIKATFGDVLRLDGVAFGKTALPGQPVWATLHFTLLRDTEVSYKVSLRLRDDGGQVIGQIDRHLLNDRHFQTQAWPPHDPALDQAINVYLLPLAPDTPPGRYRLEVVVYNAEPPYPSEGVTGIETKDGVSAIIGQVTVTAHPPDNYVERHAN